MKRYGVVSISPHDQKGTSAHTLVRLCTVDEERMALVRALNELDEKEKQLLSEYSEQLHEIVLKRNMIRIELERLQDARDSR